jgi:hypothetical protein
VVAQGVTPTDGRSSADGLVAAFRDAGATWWIESNWEGATVASLRERIEAGPPGV